jgi:hypothetical protein
MARETIYMLQTFDTSNGTSFRFDHPILFKDLANARAVADTSVAKSGLILHEIVGDPVMLDYQRPVIVHAAGVLPAGLLGPDAVALERRMDPLAEVVPAEAPAGPPPVAGTAKPRARPQNWGAPQTA